MSEKDRHRADRVYEALLQRQGERWVQPRVERTRRVLELLDDPQKTYRVVHVTGTNGKTSTSRMIESLVRAHGLRTGMFTSPHLERFTERILAPPQIQPSAGVAEDNWNTITIIDHPILEDSDFTTSAGSDEDSTESGKRRQPELNKVAATELTPVIENEFDVDRDAGDEAAIVARTLNRSMQRIARQADLDPDDGML